MSTCYLCGQQMIDKQEYLKNTQKFSSTPKFRHNEHIIQNALYGRLTDSNILCESCGAKLSETIDADFVKLFDGFTVPINHILASKDHGNSLKKTLRGFISKHDGQKIEIQVRDNKISPRRPDYDFIKEEGIVKVYANSKVIKDYRNYVLKELDKLGIDVDSLKVECRFLRMLTHHSCLC